jgi:hypothetical protein
VGCQCRLNLCLLDDLGRGAALDCLKSVQVWQRHDRCSLAAQGAPRIARLARGSSSAALTQSTVLATADILALTARPQRVELGFTIAEDCTGREPALA